MVRLKSTDRSLRHNGLITRRPHTNTYDLTADGLRFAVFYTKVHQRVLSPLFAADQPQAPPDPRGIVKLFGNACGAVDVSGLGGKRWWLTASFKPLRR